MCSTYVQQPLTVLIQAPAQWVAWMCHVRAQRRVQHAINGCTSGVCCDDVCCGLVIIDKHVLVPDI